MADSEWCTTTLGECAGLISGGTPSKQNAEYWGGKIPWASAKDMKQFRLHETQDYITEKGAENGTRVVPAGTILVLVRGMTLHNDLPICITMKDMAFNQDVKAIQPKPIIVNVEYLAYWMLAHKPYLMSLVDSASHGTGRIHTDILKAVKLDLPPLPEQKAIARILSSLDDKIELNQQMNGTLEAIARAIFKSWFVDFDPVCAKMDGKQPAGMDAATAYLFPDEFEDSVLGMIPKGWGVKPLPEVVEVNPSRSLSKGQIAPYLDMKSMPTQGHRPDNWIDRSFNSGTKFKNGDTLMARITPCLENGKTAFVDFLEDGQVGWGSTLLEKSILKPVWAVVWENKLWKYAFTQ
jgi:type I restriction enzyme, S subunit